MSEVFLGKVTGGDLMVIDRNDNGKIDEGDSFFLRQNPAEINPASTADEQSMLIYAFNECGLVEGKIEAGTSISTLKSYIEDINAAKKDTYATNPSFKNVREQIAAAREKASKAGIPTNEGVIDHLLKYSASRTITHSLLTAHVSAGKGNISDMQSSLHDVAEASAFLETNYDAIVARIVDLGGKVYAVNNGNDAKSTKKLY